MERRFNIGSSSSARHPASHLMVSLDPITVSGTSATADWTIDRTYGGRTVVVCEIRYAVQRGSTFAIPSTTLSTSTRTKTVTLDSATGYQFFLSVEYYRE